MVSINPSDMGFLSIKSFDYPCIISSGISKTEAIKLMQNAGFTEKSKSLWSIKIYYPI